jgi:hypothetical protein
MAMGDGLVDAARLIDRTVFAHVGEAVVHPGGAFTEVKPASGG